MTVDQSITISGRNGKVTYLDDKLKLVPEKSATVAKVRFPDGRIEFFFIKPK